MRSPYAGAVAGIALALVGAAGASAGTPVATLRAGDSTFWAGAFVADGRVDDPGLCGIQGPCFDYPIRVSGEHAKVLRVAISSAEDSNGWGLRLIDPHGHVAATGSTYTTPIPAENFDVEVFTHDPAPGLWTAQVIAQNVHEGDFHARAAVQGDPVLAPTAAVAAKPAKRHHKAKRKKAAGKHRKRHKARHRHRAHTRAGAALDMPPDLTADPPWHLTFEQPPPMVVVEGGNYTALAGVHNPTMQVAGQPIYECLAEETVEQHAKRCLRFTTGFASLGPGAFEVFGSSSSPVAVNGGQLYQVIHRSDGTTYSREAGRFAFHHIHMHYHVLGIAEFSFFRVGEGHAMTPAGKVLKEGFCLGNIKIYAWRSFEQAEIDPHSIDNCAPSVQPDGTYRFYEGMANGWEDAYKWQTSGQFIDFADNSDGFYVLRMLVNADRHLLETDYANDSAYAYMQVVGNHVRMIERGHGTDPWDPHKIVEDPVISQ
jgi:hypothetical protein